VSKILLPLILCVAILAAQESKPNIGKITALSTDPPLIAAVCTASRSGYLEKDGKTKMPETELATFIASSLHDGYIVTVYPESKRGIFVEMECSASTKAMAPSHP